MASSGVQLAVVGIIALIVGAGIGYAINSTKQATTVTTTAAGGTVTSTISGSGSTVTVTSTGNNTGGGGSGSPTVIKVGSIWEITGGLALYGKDFRDATTLAFSQLNQLAKNSS